MKQWLLSCIIQDDPAPGEEAMRAPELARIAISNNLPAGVSVHQVKVIPIPPRSLRAPQSQARPKARLNLGLDTPPARE
jgi:hypothetical protein